MPPQQLDCASNEAIGFDKRSGIEIDSGKLRLSHPVGDH